MPSTPTILTMDDSPVSVYVRVRPFTPAEQAKGLQPLDGLALETSALEDARGLGDRAHGAEGRAGAGLGQAL